MFSRISTKDEEMDLPLFYWMHNLHNFPEISHEKKIPHGKIEIIWLVV
jgi:hypothetical protein